MEKRDLLIFGDSYAEESIISYPKWHKYHTQVHELLSYHHFLRESGHFKSVTSYGQGGASLWDAYKNLKKYYNKDAIIVLFITDIGRFTVQTEDGTFNVSSLITLEQAIFNAVNEDKFDKQCLLESARDYMLYMRDMEREAFLHRELIDEFKKIAGDNLHLVDTFNFLRQTKPNPVDMFHLENDCFFGKGMFSQYRKTYWDLRRNHMTEDNHRIMAEQLINKIQYNLDFDFTKFVKPDTRDFGKYFKKI